jgi:flagellar motor switch protein FliN/FliY
MSNPPLSWIKQIQSELIDSGQIPMSGDAPAFPWDVFSSKIADLLQVTDLKISPRKTSILGGADLLKGLGIDPVCIALDLLPIGSSSFWAMGKEEMAQLTALALNPTEEGKGFSSPEFQEGFYYFLTTELVLLAREQNAIGDLSLAMGGKALPPEEESLCIDVEIKLPRHALWGRWICPASVQTQVKSHFFSQEPPSLTGAFAKQIDVAVHLEVGQTTLSVSEWKNVSVGDFVLLERCNFDPATQKGSGTLMLGKTPLLRARIKEENLKITDYAIYHEESYPMSPEIPPDDDYSEEEEIPEEEFSSEEPESEEPSEHLWEPANQEVEKLVSAQEIPLTLTVEVARMQINLEKLLQLSPGNTLELPVRPEQGVDVVIGGKKVAKAELIKLGEMLGIKILQLGE